MSKFIKKFKWRLGYAIIRLGWRIYSSGYNALYDCNCSGLSIEENGIKYSIDFLNI